MSRTCEYATDGEIFVVRAMRKPLTGVGDILRVYFPEPISDEAMQYLVMCASAIYKRDKPKEDV